MKRRTILILLIAFPQSPPASSFAAEMLLKTISVAVPAVPLLPA